MKLSNFIKYIFLLFFLSFVNSHANVLKSITITGNDRIQDETIKSFLPVKINDQISANSINEIIKTLYETNFFKNINVDFRNENLLINVSENPIIENIIYQGIKSNSLLNTVTDRLKLINRSSYIELYAREDVLTISEKLKNNGYYFSKINFTVENLSNNRVNLIYDIDLGEKAKIRKISFIGNKIFKDSKLRSVIVSEEHKFWKFISGKKFLNENLVNLDNRLLKNFYLNKGYYNVEIQSSFAKLINDDEFELVFNINSGKKIFFGDLKIDLPISYDERNFDKLNKTLKNLKGKHYSIYSIQKITEDIDLLALNEQFETINIDVIEKIVEDNLNIDFIINETDKVRISRINIFGNNVTRENVIRNQFEIDEGDFFNEILLNKTINNIKSLNFFETTESEVININENNEIEKIININVKEKPTGEIGASAGVGTDGETVGFFINENNYLGKGLAIQTNVTLSTEALKGFASITNPNFNDSDKSVYARVDAIEIDRLTDFGYKTNKTGFSYGTKFEFQDDLYLGFGNQNYYEKMETDSSASSLQKKQAGDYFDSFLNLDIDYDKRNLKFRTTDGYRSTYSLDLPLVSKTGTISNTYQYSLFKELYDENITSLSFFINSSHSLTNDDIKLSERNYVPSKKLRGFVANKVGPKDGNDFIGGNYVAAVNIQSSLPQIFQENQNLDFLLFFDAANIWGVDYDSTIDDTNEIRSSLGLGADWITPIGPLNFSLALPLTKSDSDQTESFRFNLGTTF
jgi:outer membrane protein insertion porin family